MSDNKPQHTQGPWHLEPSDVAVGWYQVKPYPGQVVADIFTLEDARLIAAAPEMLDALKEALQALREAVEFTECYGYYLGMDETPQRIETAVAKAEGRA